MNFSKITFVLPVKKELDILRVFNILIPTIKKIIAIIMFYNMFIIIL